MTNHTSAIELTIEPRDRPVGSGQVRRLLPHRTRRMVGPFIFTDLIGPDELTAGEGVDINAHPHIGISTLTYLLDGRMVHRDSTGSVQAIEAGAVNWMTAGSGVTHTERSHPDDLGRGRSLHGIQTWVALPDGEQEVAPAFEHLSADDVPIETIGGSVVRLAAGTGWGSESPVAGRSPLVLAGIRLGGDEAVPVETDHAEVAVLAVDGQVRINDEQIRAGDLAVVRSGGPDSSRVELSGVGTAVVLGGEPVGRRYIWWNFVHSDRERLEAAKADWLEQRFPTVPGDHDPYVPLPGS